jgi:hypothetical protein
VNDRLTEHSWTDIEEAHDQLRLHIHGQMKGRHLRAP